MASEYDREETFTERAIRTRLGSRIQRYGPSYYAEFCLGEPVPLRGAGRFRAYALLSRLLIVARILWSGMFKPVLLGNSITLMPGTLTLDVTDGRLRNRTLSSGSTGAADGVREAYHVPVTPRALRPH